MIVAITKLNACAHIVGCWPQELSGTCASERPSVVSHTDSHVPHTFDPFCFTHAADQHVCNSSPHIASLVHIRLSCEMREALSAWR